MVRQRVTVNKPLKKLIKSLNFTKSNQGFTNCHWFCQNLIISHKVHWALTKLGDSFWQWTKLCQWVLQVLIKSHHYDIYIYIVIHLKESHITKLGINCVFCSFYFLLVFLNLCSCDSWTFVIRPVHSHFLPLNASS